jgi:hypothetical protein
MRRSPALLPFTLAALVAACGENLTYPETTGQGVTVLACAPNLDGTITAEEVPVVLDSAAPFRVATGIQVNLDGTVLASGRRRFEFSGNYAGDREVALTARPLASRWYAARFPGGEFAAPMDVAGTLEGVYARGVDGLRLLGFASPTESPSEGQTLMVYDVPALVLPLPLRVGATWVATARVQGGTLRGSPYNGTDRYEGVAAGAGELRLPDLTFSSVIQVRMKATLSPSSGTPVVRRQAGFYAECFGEVARATAPDGVDDPSFTAAAEVRRFAP